ncbi:MAG: MarR family winged helix-turn-helix transcriptional regulator [Victivallaceae bacterium]|nr:MarR family winged helix-turn-helix transcriptional regulator [Victivallaceae bacterium]
MKKQNDTLKSLETLDSVEIFKRMCRMLEVERRRLFDAEWDFRTLSVPRKQYNHLLAVRNNLPCNLGRVMELTGMSSAGASIFVEKMVKLGVLERRDDPADRRNVIISLSQKANEAITQQEDNINLKMLAYFSGCTQEEAKLMEDAARLICRKITEGLTRKK